MALSADEEEKLTEWLEAIEPEVKSLNDWERGFVQDQLERHEKYGNDMRLSLKQWAALRNIYEKVTGDKADQPEIDDDEDIPF